MNRHIHRATLYILICLVVLLVVFGRQLAASGLVLYLPLMGKYQP